ncbi:MAG: hypothetical protein E6G94_01795 [Alphaproteobacteria bacterium]|nr:MAG: hypothetical protein E6G94_01795 [Alphaproteobacteria bacterium]
MRPLPILLALVLAACAAQPPLIVRAVTEGDACRVHVDGAAYAPDELTGPRLQTLRAKTRRLVVDAAPGTPYRCVGGTVFMLQRAGFDIVSVQGNGAQPLLD